MVPKCWLTISGASLGFFHAFTTPLWQSARIWSRRDLVPKELRYVMRMYHVFAYVYFTHYSCIFILQRCKKISDECRLMLSSSNFNECLTGYIVCAIFSLAMGDKSRRSVMQHLDLMCNFILQVVRESKSNMCPEVQVENL